MKENDEMTDFALGLQHKGWFISTAFLKMTVSVRFLRVHEIEIKIVHVACVQLALEERANICFGSGEVADQLVRQNVMVAGIMAGQTGLQRQFTLALNIAAGRVEVIEACVQKSVYHALRFFQIDPVLFIGICIQPKLKLFLIRSMIISFFPFRRLPASQDDDIRRPYPICPCRE